MTLWMNRSGKHCQHERKFLDEKRIYLTWDGLNTNLGTLRDREELVRVLDSTYPHFTPGRKRNYTGQIWAFAHSMMPGDWVAVPSKRKTIHIGEITGPYTYDTTQDNPYYHHHTVRWLEIDIPRTNFDQDILNSLNSIGTICRIKRNNAEQRVRAMQANVWRSTGVRPVPSRNVEIDDDETDDGTSDVLDLEQIGRDHIARLIYAKYAGHGMEELVEAILQAQGFTTHHSPKGADGGIDLLAAPDTLGFGRPRICVQVKSQDSALERPVLDQLVGTMQHVDADQGLLVCWGGFKPTIIREVPRLFFKVRMWDQNDLIDQFLAVYDKLDEDLQAQIPLKRIWAVASPEEDESE